MYAPGYRHIHGLSTKFISVHVNASSSLIWYTIHNTQYSLFHVYSTDIFILGFYTIQSSLGMLYIVCILYFVLCFVVSRYIYVDEWWMLWERERKRAFEIWWDQMSNVSHTFYIILLYLILYFVSLVRLSTYVSSITSKGSK